MAVELNGNTIWRKRAETNFTQRKVLNVIYLNSK